MDGQPSSIYTTARTDTPALTSSPHLFLILGRTRLCAIAGKRSPGPRRHRSPGWQVFPAEPGIARVRSREAWTLGSFLLTVDIPIPFGSRYWDKWLWYEVPAAYFWVWFLYVPFNVWRTGLPVQQGPHRWEKRSQEHGLTLPDSDRLRGEELTGWLKAARFSRLQVPKRAPINHTTWRMAISSVGRSVGRSRGGNIPVTQILPVSRQPSPTEPTKPASRDGPCLFHPAQEHPKVHMADR